MIDFRDDSNLVIRIETDDYIWEIHAESPVLTPIELTAWFNSLLLMEEDMI